SCINWDRPVALQTAMKKIPNTKNPMSDQVQIYMNTERAAGRSIPIGAYIYRCTDKRRDQDTCNLLFGYVERICANHVTDHQKVNAFGELTEAPAYTQDVSDASHLCLIPGLPTEYPVAAMSAGMRLTRELSLAADTHPEKVIIIASTLNVASPVMGVQNNTVVEPSVVIALDYYGRVLLAVIVNANMPDQKRRLWPNVRIDTTTVYGFDLAQVRAEVLKLIGYDVVVVGWKIGATLAALHISLPAAQVIDLSTEPHIRRLVNEVNTVNYDAFAIAHLPLPEAVYWLSRKALNLRHRDDGDYRDSFVEAQMVDAIWRATSSVILEQRRVDNPLMAAAAGGIYTGAGRLPECIAYEAEANARKAANQPMPFYNCFPARGTRSIVPRLEAVPDIVRHLVG
ncbi:MAG: hypothetical protein FD187_3213, partial [bacterium]